MPGSATRANRPMAWAMAGAGFMIAHQVAGKAARDGFFLMEYAASDLPKMVVTAAALSIALALLSGKILQSIGPRLAVPATFAFSAALHLAEWLVLPLSPHGVAPIIYLHIVGLGAILLSGFWLMLSETFDLREAKTRFGQIAGAGTAGGILGGLIAERIAALTSTDYLLALLAVLHVACAFIAWQVRPRGRRAPDPEDAVSVREAFKGTPMLWQLAGLVFLGTCSAALLDYLFKLGATMEMGKGPSLVRFFAIYYTGAQVLTFVIQTFAARPIAVNFGLGPSVASLPLMVGIGSTAALLVPIYPLVAAVRGIEAILRGSLFRASYEFLYAPVPPQHKRSVKTVIDVGCDRLGDAAGAGAVQVMMWLGPALARPEILGLTMLISAVSTWLALRLNLGYRGVIEQGLVERAREEEKYDVQSTMLNTVFEGIPAISLNDAPPSSPPSVTTGAIRQDRVLTRMAELRSQDAKRVLRALERDDPWDSVLVPQVIRLLAWNEVSVAACDYLEKGGSRIVGQLNDSLADQELDFGIRRRIPRLLARQPSQLSADGLVQGLADPRFEIRYQCGRALDYMKRHYSDLHYAPQTIMDVVRRELSVSMPVWRSRRLVENGDLQDADRLIEGGGGSDRNLEHVFSLLAVILPRQAVTAAFHGLYQADHTFRALALEYLENVLPNDVRERLWAIIEETPVSAANSKVLADDMVRASATLRIALKKPGSEAHATMLAPEQRGQTKPDHR